MSFPPGMGSSRFPGKPLATIGGIPMLGPRYLRSRMNPRLDGVFIATCDEEIRRYALEIGAECIMTSPLHERASDRTAEAVGPHRTHKPTRTAHGQRQRRDCRARPPADDPGAPRRPAREQCPTDLVSRAKKRGKKCNRRLTKCPFHSSMLNRSASSLAEPPRVRREAHLLLRGCARARLALAGSASRTRQAADAGATEDEIAAGVPDASLRRILASHRDDRHDLTSGGSRGNRPIRLHRSRDRERLVEPDRHAVRAGRPALRLRAKWSPACDQGWCAPSESIYYTQCQRQRGARPARRRLRSRVPHQSLRLRVRHGHVADRAQPGQPVHRERGRGGPGSEVVLLELDNLSSCDQSTTAARCTSDPTANCTPPSGDNASGSNAQTLEQPARQDAPHQPGRLDPGRQSVLRHDDRQEPRDLGAGAAQPVHVRVQSARHRDVRQRRRARALGGDQRRIAGANYGWPATEGPTSDPQFDTPRYSYGRTGGQCAITGGTFYSPLAMRFPSDYSNDYFFADYCAGWIRKLDPATGSVVTFATGFSAPVDLKVSDDGGLYYLVRGSGTNTGAVYRIDYGAAMPGITTHPVSQTVLPGQWVTFSVTASGPPVLRYQWQRNGINIAGATSADLYAFGRSRPTTARASGRGLQRRRRRLQR